MTPEEIEARIQAIADRNESELRRFVTELTMPPPPPPPPSPPPPPPVITDPWHKERTIYRPPAGGRELWTNNRQELIDHLSMARPGDVIFLKGNDYGQVEWRNTLGHQSGIAGAPIVLQAAPGEKPEFIGSGLTNNSHAFRVENINHHIVSGITVKNAQFAMREWGCHSWRAEHMTIENAGHAGLSVQRATNMAQSTDFVISDSIVRKTGRSTDTYGEGIYLGNGSKSWVDCPTRGQILRCDISETRGDAIDLKAGCADIELGWLKIHDCDVPMGSAITHTNARIGDDDPNPVAIKPIYGHDLDIWNIGWGGIGPAYGITCHLGGETWENVRMWGFKPDGTPTVNTRGFNLRGTSKSSQYPIVIQDSIVWVNRSIINYFNPDVTAPPIKVKNVLTPDGLMGSTKVLGTGFPALNAKSQGDVSGLFPWPPAA